MSAISRSCSTWLLGLAAVASLIAALASSAAAYPRPGTTRRASVNASGVPAGGSNYRAAVSEGGRFVAFYSSATNLDPAATNGNTHVFVHDFETGATTLVSRSSAGVQGNGDCISQIWPPWPAPPAISPDGRYVAFYSNASNLVAGDVNGAWDVFLRDRLTGTTELISVATDGTRGNGNSGGPTLTPDGRYVAFYSQATTLIPGPDGNFFSDVFVRDRVAGTTERVSVSATGGFGFLESYDPSISADGRWVAFYSLSPNLVPDDTNNRTDVFVKDRQTGAIELVSRNSNDIQGNDSSFSPWMSPDARFVAFASAASNLVPRYGKASGSNGDVYVRDRTTGVTERVSVSSLGLEGNQNAGVSPGIAGAVALSADGRYAHFMSFSTNHVPGDANGFVDAFVHDRLLGTTERVDLSASGAEANTGVTNIGLSPDGRFPGFQSESTNLVPDGGGGGVFVRDRGLDVAVGGLATTCNGGNLDVTGWVTLSGAPLASATDPADDGLLAARAEGAELVGASFAYRPEQEDFLVRLELDSLPPAPAGVVYVLEFTNGFTRFEARAAEPSTFQLFHCGGNPCSPFATLTGSIGTTGNEVLISVPIAVLGASPGATLTGLRAFAGPGSVATGVATVLDEVALGNAPIPVSSVTLGTAPDGTPEEQVTFGTAAQLSQGALNGSVPDPSQPCGQAYRLWARACLGSLCRSASMRILPCFVASPGRAAVSTECLPNLTIPAGITLVGASAAVSDPAGRFEVIARDFANNPVANVTIVIDFSNCQDVRLASTQSFPGVTINCAAKTVSAVTNVAGVATFVIEGSVLQREPASRTACAAVTGDGIAFGYIKVAVADQDGVDGVTANDFSLFQCDRLSGSPPLRSDYDHSGSVNPADLSLLAGLYFSGGSTATPLRCDSLPTSTGPVVEAGGLNLAWNNCVLGGGTNLATFACDSNDGFIPPLVFSVVAPPGVPAFSGFEAEVLIMGRDPGTPLPDWWRLDPAGCRSAGFSFNLAPPPACGALTGPALAYDVSYPYQAPHIERIRIVGWGDSLRTLVSGEEYTLFTLDVDRSRTTTCTGCGTPVTIRFESLELVQGNGCASTGQVPPPTVLVNQTATMREAYSQSRPTGVEPEPAASLALARANANPAPGELRVTFSLPSAEPARLELFDLSGRRLKSQSVGALGPGRHSVVLAARGELGAGLFFVRLDQGGESRLLKMTVLR